MEKFPIIPANKQSIANRLTVHGVGINDSNYIIEVRENGKIYKCPYYRTWNRMIERCYSEKFHQRKPTYKDCSVCSEWLIFSNFKRWMEKQEWHGKSLDKDIIKHGNKIYSEDNCCFVSVKLNNLFIGCGVSHGEWALGVSRGRSDKLFAASCCYNGHNERIGRFNTPEEAHAAYRKRKNEIIYEAAMEQTDERIRNGLLRHIKENNNDRN